MSIFEQNNGSEALAQRIYAFGSAVGTLCDAGLDPVLAVTLVLCAAVVLATVRV
ncbi:hypothetical protein D9M69_557930 [compost metagenome]